MRLGSQTTAAAVVRCTAAFRLRERPARATAGFSLCLDAALVGQAPGLAAGHVCGAPAVDCQADAWLRISNVVSSGGAVKPPSMPACIRGISVPSRN